MTRKKTNWFAVLVSVAILLGLFFVGLNFMQKHVEIASVAVDAGTLELVPIVSEGEGGTVEMRLRYIPVGKVANVFNYIYEHSEVALSDENHTALYLLKNTNEENNTRDYKVEKIVNATFTRVLTLPSETFDALTTPSKVEYQSADDTYKFNVDALNGIVYLKLAEVEA